MTPTAVAICAAGLDAALHSYPTRGDLAREIMARAHWLHNPYGIEAMAATSGGEIFGAGHLARLRQEWNRNN
jgi:hypothetical protein